MVSGAAAAENEDVVGSFRARVVSKLVRYVFSVMIFINIVFIVILFHAKLFAGFVLTTFNKLLDSIGSGVLLLSCASLEILYSLKGEPCVSFDYSKIDHFFWSNTYETPTSPMISNDFQSLVFPLDPVTSVIQDDIDLQCFPSAIPDGINRHRWRIRHATPHRNVERSSSQDGTLNSDSTFPLQKTKLQYYKSGDTVSTSKGPLTSHNSGNADSIHTNHLVRLVDASHESFQSLQSKIKLLKDVRQANSRVLAHTFSHGRHINKDIKLLSTSSLIPQITATN